MAKGKKSSGRDRRRIIDVLKDEKGPDEILDRSKSGEFRRARQLGIGPDALTRAATPLQPGPPADNIAEAIILEHGRPALLIQNGTFEVPENDQWKTRLYPHKRTLEDVIERVGRVELTHHPEYQWVGTAWMLTDNLAVTNRHVAQTFSQKNGNAFAFARALDGNQMTARVDFREEHLQTATAFEVEVKNIKYVADSGQDQPDWALLELKPKSRAKLPPPIRLSTEDLAGVKWVAAIGYPAYDSRNGDATMSRIFRDIYDVKRLAPGKVTGAANPNWIVKHDCSTLGGNSGSPIIDVESGRVVALHFAGSFLTTNYAVTAQRLRDALDEQGVKVSVAIKKKKGKKSRPELATEGPQRKASDYAGREGYLPDFLGQEPKYLVPLPSVPKTNGGRDVVTVPNTKAPNKDVLLYTHFSVQLCKSRKLAWYTACNIDGNNWMNIPRKGDAWFLDPRVKPDVQTGPQVYANNDLDRGHLVRRQDPLWGNKPIAKLANEDTFHYTNAAPQHKDLNQKTWLSLEDYILGNADAKDLKVSVFTGPVLDDDDPVYRQVKLPRQYWKVAVLVNKKTGSLSATGYLLTQAGMIKDLTEFVYGKFRTYQVPIARIEKLTGLDFGKLRNVDPLKGQTEVEGFGGPGGQEIRGPQDLTL